MQIKKYLSPEKRLVDELCCILYAKQKHLFLLDVACILIYAPSNYFSYSHRKPSHKNYYLGKQHSFANRLNLYTFKTRASSWETHICHTQKSKFTKVFLLALYVSTWRKAGDEWSRSLRAQAEHATFIISSECVQNLLQEMFFRNTLSSLGVNDLWKVNTCKRQCVNVMTVRTLAQRWTCRDFTVIWKERRRHLERARFSI